MNRILGTVSSGAFDAALAVAFLSTWIDPFGPLARPVASLLLLMLIEFITIHSSALLGSVWLERADRRHRLVKFAGLTAMYSVFVGAFSAGFGTWLPLILFWILSANRVVGMAAGPDPDHSARKASERRWARAVVFYLLGAFIVTLFPIPELGIGLVIDRIDIPGSGQWVDQPWRVVAFGVLYFSLSGVAQFLDAFRSARDPRSADQEPAEELVRT